MDKKVNLMLDSGAFSAWRQQNPIDVKEYAKYLEKNYDIVDTVINLDVMPGECGKERSLAEVDYSATQSFKNFIYLRKCGFETMPVFHQGENFVWLEKILDAGGTYIGVSPINNARSKVRMLWMDKVFAYLCGDKGFPEVKTHGFGMTVPSLVNRYPWYSVDSISWILIGAFGSILIPRLVNGKPDYKEKVNLISMSTRGSKFVRAGAGTVRSYQTFGIKEKKCIEDYCNQLGFDIASVQTNGYVRKEINLLFYKNLANSFTPKIVSERAKSLFMTNKSSLGTTHSKWNKLKFVFGGGGGSISAHGEILQRNNEHERLLSYYEMRSKPETYLSYYINTGQFPKTRKKLHKSKSKTKRVRNRIIKKRTKLKRIGE